MITNIIIICAAIFLVSFRIVRSKGFQRYNTRTLILRMVFLSVIAIYPVFYALSNHAALFYNCIGVVAGLMLSYIATNQAEFQKKDGEMYYKTHITVEIVIVFLFLVRFAYRLIVFKEMLRGNYTQQDIQENQSEFLRSPLTGFVLFVVAAYYISYFAFILNEGKKVLNEEKEEI